MSQDNETIKVYGREAERYAEVFLAPEKDPALALFVEHLPAGSTVLDLGCGPGFAAGYMTSLGHRAIATDATPEMVEMASGLPGVDARLATFDDITGTDVFDGIWANFCLLHAPRTDLPRHLATLKQALKPGGRLLREWNGVTHVVEVTETGFLWNGETWRSLSAIARAITGTHWSGPRFFGLTGKATK